MAAYQPSKRCCIQSAYGHTSDQEVSSLVRFCQHKRYSGISQTLRKIFFWVLPLPSIYKNEGGMVTAVALLLLAALALLGATSMVVTSTDILISGNYKVSEVAFYAAEAGVEEARARLRGSAVDKITDTAPSVPEWRAYIGTLAMSQAKGFNPSSAFHSRTDSLSSMNYVVEIRHKVDAANPNKVMYWDGVKPGNTTTGTNIYLVTSTGYTGNSNRSIEVEVTRDSPITVPSPLYVKSDTKIMGTSTYISGIDKCGGSDRPAIITTQSLSSVSITGQPTIQGSPENIKVNGPNLDVAAMVHSLKALANFSYNVTSSASATQTGMNWGIPTLGANPEDPSTCSVHNIVYYNTNGIGITLAGGSSGCGILLVEGDLEVHGGFTWYGVVVVTESLTYTGGGNKQVTGGMLSGGTVDADVEIGGNANIVYCSSAVNNQTANLPLRVLSWRDGNYTAQ